MQVKARIELIFGGKILSRGGRNSKSKHVIFSGAATGSLLAIFILSIFVILEVDPGSFTGLCGGFFGLATLSALIINGIWKRAQWSELNLKILIPVACITSIMPLFGPLFGLPNTSLITLATIVAFGAIGGIFWSTPFALWIHFRRPKSFEESE